MAFFCELLCSPFSFVDADNEGFEDNPVKVSLLEGEALFTIDAACC